MQESLGGNAKTTLVVAVADAQEHAEETFNSLQFGSRAMCVQTQVRGQQPDTAPVLYGYHPHRLMKSFAQHSVRWTPALPVTRAVLFSIRMVPVFLAQTAGSCQR